MIKQDSQLGDTIPLYDEVKKTIYINFNEMSYAYAYLMTCNKGEYKIVLLDFKKRFIKFFLQVNHPNKLNKLDEKKKNYLKESYTNLNKIDRKKASNIISISRELIEILGITKIEGKIRDTWGI